MPDLNLPEWLTMPQWLEPKLIVFFVLVGGVLFLSRDRGEDRGQRRVAAILEHGKQ